VRVFALVAREMLVYKIIVRGSCAAKTQMSSRSSNGRSLKFVAISVFVV